MQNVSSPPKVMGLIVLMVVVVVVAVAEFITKIGIVTELVIFIVV